MPHRRMPLIALIALPLAMGCDESAPIVGTAHDSAAALAEDLRFLVPHLSPDDVASHSFETTVADPSEQDPSANGPLLTSLDGRPAQKILNARTNVGFDPGYAWSVGRHEYIGNVGEVSTTAHVTHESKHLGSQTAHRQNDVPFLIDFGTVKLIWAQAKVYTDHECGLSVQGTSDHKARWQFWNGSTTSSWGEARLSTQASPANQGGCARSTGQMGLTETTSSGMVCYYLITYDMNTMEVLRADFLYCTGSGGPLM